MIHSFISLFHKCRPPVMKRQKLGESVDFNDLQMGQREWDNGKFDSIPFHILSDELLKIEKEESKDAKIAILAKVLQQIIRYSENDFVQLVHLLCGKIEGKTITSPKNCYLEIAYQKLDPKKTRADGKKAIDDCDGDVGMAFQKVRPKRSIHFGQPHTTLQQVTAVIQQVEHTTHSTHKGAYKKERGEQMANLFKRLFGAEAKYAARIINGSFGIGVDEEVVCKAIAVGFVLARLEPTAVDVDAKIAWTKIHMNMLFR